MAVVAEELISDLIVRDGKLKSGLASAKATYSRAVGDMRSDTKRLEADVSKSTAAIGSSFGRMFAGITAGVGVGALAKGFLQLADEAKNLDAQLRLATAASGSFAQAQDDVRRIASDSRAGLKETADLYGVFMRSARELGITQEQAARSTETITKAFQISGASAAEAAGGMRQLLQGIQSGTLRGEELNSVLENAPRLARALADGLGVTIGQLREMGAEGEITGAKVVKALEGAADSIDAEFAQLPVTFDQAMTKVYNSAVITFGAFDRGGEFSTALANFISDGSNGFEDMEESATTFGRNVRSEMEGLAAAFGPVIAQMSELLNLFGTASSQGPIFAKLTGEIDSITKWLGQQGMLGKAIAGGGSNLQGRYLGEYNANQRNSARRAGEQQLRDSLQGRDVFGNPINRGSAPRAGGGGTASGGRRRAAGATARSPLDPEAFAREEADLNDRILKLKADEADNIEARTMAELKRLESAQTAAVNEVQTDKRYTEQQKAKLTALLGTTNALEQAEVLADRDLEVAKQAAEANETSLRYHMDALQSQAALARSRQERLEIEDRILAAVEAQETAELEAAIAAGKVADVTQARADLRTTQGNRRTGAEDDLASPMEKFRKEAVLSADEINDAFESIQVDGINSLTDGIADAITGAQSLGDVFKNVANQIISDLIRIAVQQAVVGALGSAFGGGTGGGGGFLGGLFGGGKASGGSVSAGTLYRVNEGAKEFFRPAVDGTIIQGSQAQAARPAGGMGGGGPVIVQLSVAPGELFRPTVEAISGDVSIRTVQAAAPGIVKAAGVETSRQLSRQRV